MRKQSPSRSRSRLLLLCLRYIAIALTRYAYLVALAVVVDGSVVSVGMLFLRLLLCLSNKTNLTVKHLAMKLSA